MCITKPTLKLINFAIYAVTPKLAINVNQMHWNECNCLIDKNYSSKKQSKTWMIICSSIAKSSWQHRLVCSEFWLKPFKQVPYKEYISGWFIGLGLVCRVVLKQWLSMSIIFGILFMFSNIAALMYNLVCFDSCLWGEILPTLTHSLVNLTCDRRTVHAKGHYHVVMSRLQPT
jgi:hypothetical protein